MIKRKFLLTGIMVLCLNSFAEILGNEYKNNLGNEYKNNIAVNLLAIPVGNGVISYEHNFNRQSLWLGLEHHFNNLVTSEERNLNSVALELRHYFKGKVSLSDGFFAGLYTKFRTGEEISMDIPGHSHSYKAVFAGLNAGYQYHFNRFVVSAFAGYGIPVIINEDEIPEAFSHELNEGYKQDLRLGLTAGFAF